jgi:hypothetical protein
VGFLPELDGLSYDKEVLREGKRMKRIVIATIALAVSVTFAAAQPANERYEPGLGEFMTATQLRHAKLWFAGRESNWDLAAYEIDEIREGLDEARRLHPTLRHSRRRDDEDHHRSTDRGA